VKWGEFAEHHQWNDKNGWKNLLNNLRLVIQPFIVFNLLMKTLYTFQKLAASGNWELAILRSARLLSFPVAVQTSSSSLGFARAWPSVTDE